MIRLTDVQKEYENGTHALRGVTMEVNDGEFVFLVLSLRKRQIDHHQAPHGRGALPSGGRLMINGFNLNNISDRQIPLLRRSIGVIFQDFRLIEKKTVYENLSFAMRAVGSSPREAKKRIPYVLKLVGLDGKANQFPNQLSGGEQQRVAIARALVNNPYTIIADEPTGNLDPARSLEIMMLLERINQLGTTVLVVTHEKDLVNKFQKRVITLERGIVVSDGIGYNMR